MRTRPPKFVDDVVTADCQYARKSEDHITRLAFAIRNGEVFGSWMVQERDIPLLHNIFLVMSYMHDIRRKELRRDGIVHFYGWMGKALPRKVEGYPCFMECEMLDREDALRLMRRIREVESGEVRDEEYAF